jgi:DNA-binding IclR family transcriptional regulator
LRGPTELQRILARVRREGLAENHEETAPGLYTASVPVINEAGTVLAAMTVCIPTSRLTAARRAEILPDLITAGRTLSCDVAWLDAYHARRR